MTLTHTSALPPPRGQSRQFHPGLAPGPPLVESVRQLLLKERERHGERGGGERERDKERKREREMQTAWQPVQPSVNRTAISGLRRCTVGCVQRSKVRCSCVLRATMRRRPTGSGWDAWRVMTRGWVFFCRLVFLRLRQESMSIRVPGRGDRPSCMPYVGRFPHDRS
jgi:hypothetical protein